MTFFFAAAMASDWARIKDAPYRLSPPLMQDPLHWLQH